LQRLALQTRMIISNIVKYAWFEDEETTVDPTFTGLRLFGELAYCVFIEHEIAEPRWWVNCGYCGELAVGAMKCHERTNVHIAEAIFISHHKGLVSYPFFKMQQATTGHGVDSFIYDSDP